MGTLLYGSTFSIGLDDRVLAHLQLVIVAKLRRREAFTFTWLNPDSEQRFTVWLHDSVPLVFKYDGTVMPSINREWLELLTDSASSPQGMRLLDEPSPKQAPA
jgi:hypothetical protein